MYTYQKNDFFCIFGERKRDKCSRNDFFYTEHLTCFFLDSNVKIRINNYSDEFVFLGLILWRMQYALYHHHINSELTYSYKLLCYLLKTYVLSILCHHSHRHHYVHTGRYFPVEKNTCVNIFPIMLK